MAQDEDRDVNNLTATQGEKFKSLLSVVANAIPYLGGPIGSFMSGRLVEQRFERFRQFVEELADDLRGFKSEASEKYCRTDEFAELFERTSNSVVIERNDNKRRVYGQFLKGIIASPGGSYDEHLNVLRIIDEIQGDHIRVLKAMMQEPDPNPPGWSGSILGTLERRLPGISSDRIAELVDDIQNLRLTKLAGIKVMMTAGGAEDLRHALTNRGKVLVKYLSECD